jgi:hypothetical protein
MASQLHYRRVVLTVREGGAPAPAFRLAAELARALELELEGVFVEDEALLALAGLPFARELSLPGHTWQALDAARVLEDFRAAAETTRRLLADAAAAIGMASGFSVLRTDPAALWEKFLASDILVLVQAAAASGPAPAAPTCAAAMMLVPKRPRTAPGAIAAAPDGASLATATAAALARRSGEDLLLILPGNSSSAPADFPPARILRRRVPANDAAAVARAVRAANARLLVIERSALPGDPAALAAASGAPVLVVGDGPEPRQSPG